MTPFGYAEALGHFLQLFGVVLNPQDRTAPATGIHVTGTGPEIAGVQRNPEIVLRINAQSKTVFMPARGQTPARGHSPEMIHSSIGIAVEQLRDFRFLSDKHAAIDDGNSNGVIQTCGIALPLNQLRMARGRRARAPDFAFRHGNRVHHTVVGKGHIRRPAAFERQRDFFNSVTGYGASTGFACASPPGFIAGFSPGLAVGRNLDAISRGQPVRASARAVACPHYLAHFHRFGEFKLHPAAAVFRADPTVGVAQFPIVQM